MGDLPAYAHRVPFQGGLYGGGYTACMKRLLTLWRMSAVRVRLPPAPWYGSQINLVDVDKSL
jgi:hypothetical protein